MTTDVSTGLRQPAGASTSSPMGSLTGGASAPLPLSMTTRESSVVRELDDVIACRGRTRTITSDNGKQTDIDGGPALVSADSRRTARHCARQAHAERLHRKLQ